MTRVNARERETVRTLGARLSKFPSRPVNLRRGSKTILRTYCSSKDILFIEVKS